LAFTLALQSQPSKPAVKEPLNKTIEDPIFVQGDISIKLLIFKNAIIISTVIAAFYLNFFYYYESIHLLSNLLAIPIYSIFTFPVVLVLLKFVATDSIRVIAKRLALTTLKSFIIVGLFLPSLVLVLSRMGSYIPYPYGKYFPSVGTVVTDVYVTEAYVALKFWIIVSFILFVLYEKKYIGISIKNDSKYRLFALMLIIIVSNIFKTYFVYVLHTLPVH
jgi:hypothetical protein